MYILAQFCIFLTFLAPGVPYEVRIAALNRAGKGESVVVIHFTKELGLIFNHPKLIIYVQFSIVPISPLNVSVTRPSATVMVVSWIPLSYSEARGFISHYTVVYSPLTSGRSSQVLDTMTEIVPGMDTNTTRIEDMDANTDYIVLASATNGAGRSDVSSPLLVPSLDDVEGRE